MECTNLEQESQTEPLDIKLVQPMPRSCDSPGSLPPPAAPTSASTQIQVGNNFVILKIYTISKLYFSCKQCMKKFYIYVVKWLCYNRN